MKNYAFISYSHADKKKVRKFHKRIENFKIPGYVRRMIKNSPKRIYPIFRDETDGSGTVLESMLKNELHDSDFLIVICTEGSGQSGWVELEIEEFIREHEVEGIIPVILDEKAKAELQNDYPEGLVRIGKSRGEALRYSFRNRARCVFEIVTKLLHCSSESLTNEYLRKRRKSRYIKFYVMILVLYITWTEAYWPFMDNVEKVRYYKDVTFENDRPRGVDRLYRYQLKDQEEYYIVSRGYNSSSVRIEHIDKTEDENWFPCSYLLEAERMEIEFNQNWESSARVSKVTFQDKNGRTLFVKNYSLTREVVDLTMDSVTGEPFYLPANLLETDPSQIFSEHTDQERISCRYAPFYDGLGRLGQVWFFGDTESGFVCDENGYYGVEFVYNEDGEVETVLFMDIQTEVMAEYKVDMH